MSAPNMICPDGVDPVFYDLLLQASGRYWAADCASGPVPDVRAYANLADISGGVEMHLKGVAGFTVSDLKERSDTDIIETIMDESNRRLARCVADARRDYERSIRTEARLRGKLKRRGYGLQKSRSRSPSNPQRGQFHIYDLATNSMVAGGSPVAYSLDLDEVGAFVKDLNQQEAEL